jgi:ATP-dependent DNA helicase PIF1
MRPLIDKFPLRLAYAITVHKSQGLTLSRVVLNLNQKQHCLGLSYVAVSRVKTLAGLLFEIPFDFDRFVLVDSAVSRDRKLDYTFRNTQLL